MDEKFVGNAFSGGSCYSYRPCRVVKFLCHSQIKHIQITDRCKVKQTKEKSRWSYPLYTKKIQKNTRVWDPIHTVKPILEMTRRYNRTWTVKESDERKRGREKTWAPKKPECYLLYKKFIASYLRELDTWRCSFWWIYTLHVHNWSWFTIGKIIYTKIRLE